MRIEKFYEGSSKLRRALHTPAECHSIDVHINFTAASRRIGICSRCELRRVLRVLLLVRRWCAAAVARRRRFAHRAVHARRVCAAQQQQWLPPPSSTDGALRSRWRVAAWEQAHCAGSAPEHWPLPQRKGFRCRCAELSALVYERYAKRLLLRTQRALDGRPRSRSSLRA